MDTSPEYIAMCKAAEEIQREWRPKLGDWCLLDKEIILVIEGNEDGWVDAWVNGDTLDFPKDRLIWLPRQDQLQEMIIGELRSHQLASDFGHWANWPYTTRGCEAWNRQWSFEQLWLVYVMRQKYGKRWDGKAWVG